jgi:hypothetical protein
MWHSGNLWRAVAIATMSVLLTTFATIASADSLMTAGVITACVNKSSGAIQIVSAGSRCAGNQVKLDWNRQGPKGDTGPRGPAGPSGLSGLQGPVVVETSLGPGDSRGDAEVTCPPGKFPISGGASVTIDPTLDRSTTPMPVVAVNRPWVTSDKVRSWLVQAYRPPNQTYQWTVLAAALCVDLPQ